MSDADLFHRAYPLTAPEPDARFTYAMQREVARVLTDHGYPPLSPLDTAALASTLLRFIHRLKETS